MKSILVIHPYFGRFPKMFPFWLESCKLNKTVDFLIVTNQEIQSDSDNIIIKKSSLTQVKSELEAICGMNIWLEKPYKLCDFRPLFGNYFQNILKSMISGGIVIVIWSLAIYAIS